MPDRPWQHIQVSTVTIDTLGEQVAALVRELAEPISTPEDDHTPLAAARSAVRALSGATARLRQAADSLEVLAAGMVEQHHTFTDDLSTTSRNWLAHHHGLTHHQASALCRATRTRERFSRIDRAFIDGELTVEHLEAVGHIIPSRLKHLDRNRAIEAVVDIQDVLIEAAGRSTVQEFRGLCAQVRDHLDADGPGDRAAEPSRIWLNQLPNGRWALDGDLSEADGAVLASLIADLIARNGRRRTHTEPPEDAAETQAPEPEPVDEEPWTPRAEQAAAALVELALNGAGATKPGRVGLYLHIDLEDLAHHDVEGLDDFIRKGGTTAHTEAGIDLSTNTIWSLIADADVTPVFNWDGTPLSYGRTRRLAPPVLRRILAHRDRRCRIPGCTAPPNRCDIHHVIDWDDGGTTDTINCANGCTSHHRHSIHKQGWKARGNANGHLEILRPDGRLFTNTPAYLDRMLARRGPDPVTTARVAAIRRLRDRERPA